MSEAEVVRNRSESFASLFLSSEDNQSTHASASTDSVRDGDGDVPNEYGNTSMESDNSEYQELQDQVQTPPICTSNSWEMNYHEAAIFLEEGENNDKFNSHPRDRDALPAYIVTHNHWFYSLDLCAALLLMSLATIEQPAVFHGVPIGVHGSIELFGLFLLGISIVMQLRWLGFRTFLQHKRSMVKSVTWVVMILEAVVVIVRDHTHFRVTRSLRPIFFVDSRYLGGVRRFLRQILQSVPPILEVLGILFFVLIIFTTLGFYFFSPNQQNPYFTTFQQGFVSLYVLLTTANFPDVMMPAYAKNPWSAAFFIAFLAINLYFLMNLMLAVVFVVFSDIEKDKFRKLLVHKRRACQYSFRLLVTRSQPTHIPFRHFQGLLKFFRPHTSHRDSYLIFKALNRSESGLLSLTEFYNIYEICGFKWRPYEPPEPWFNDLPDPLRGACYLIRRLVIWRWFNFFVYAVIVVNALTLLVSTILLSASGQPITHDLHVTWDQIIFVAFYGMEAIIKMIGLGFKRYFYSGWNIYDFIVTVLSMSGIIAEQFDNSFFYVVILRPLRLLRLFRMRKRYRDVFQTLVILTPRVISAIVVIIITYYFFAIIGMEMFSKYDMKNCCVNTTVEQFYKDDNTTVYVNYYYLNNFDNIFIAGVTLFELTVVNNWFIIMEGYAAVTNEWSRLYFMLFYLVMMVVMSVVVAFILEAFTFRMEYNQTVQGDKDRDEENVFISMDLTKEELRFVYSGAVDTPTLQQYARDLETQGVVRYEGMRRRTRDVLQRRMYQEEIPGWLVEADREYQDSPGLPAPQAVIRQHTDSVPISSPSVHETSQQTPPSFYGALNPNTSTETQRNEISFC
ncbi:two pore calcium channel protein 1-like isoform X2 [Homarus americanus]|uniref:two pore calcium channel protein 1-like isoform X2 n=1 Tax=Homarus americanus TaxID=6706 RepID=UPI001C46C7AB|nr:two pore calcium channel protein 1-like isoform X2 [Homarus americanus]